MTRIDELVQEALQLTTAERAAMVDRLLLSLDADEWPQREEHAESAWGEEIARRSDLIHSGNCALLSHEEAMAEARAHLARLRAS